MDYFDPTGKRVSKSFRKKKDAQVECFTAIRKRQKKQGRLSGYVFLPGNGSHIKDLKIAMRYAHLSTEFAREEIKLLNGLTSGKKKADSHEMVTNSNLVIATTS